jgi:hypothetical protein
MSLLSRVEVISDLRHELGGGGDDWFSIYFTPLFSTELVILRRMVRLILNNELECCERRL